jgi:protein-S-isoprenylcysteine O-methyltransferase Ste14
MNNETFYRLATLFLLVAMFSISIYFRHRAERQAGSLRTDEGKRLVLGLRLLALLILLPLLGYLLNPQWVTWARASWPDWLRWIGVISGLATIPLGYWVFSSLGNNVSPTQATRQGHSLVTHGPYRWIRHPLYTAGILFWLSIILVSAVWWTGIGFLLILVLLLWRTPKEEARLIEAFGDEYRAYMARTGRYWPRLR